MKVHYSSKSSVWETPQAFFDRYHKIFRFNIDVCATKRNAKCLKYFSPRDDGLKQKWHGVCWMNPPYGRGIHLWVQKAYMSSLAGATVVCLLPARTDTGWFHDYCTKGKIEFIRGRLRFSGSSENAPFPNMVVVFHGKRSKQKTPAS